MNRKPLSAAIVGAVQDEGRMEWRLDGKSIEFVVLDEIMDRAWEEVLLGKSSEVVSAGLFGDGKVTMDFAVTKELETFIRGKFNDIQVVTPRKKDGYRDMEFRGKRNRWARG